MNRRINLTGRNSNDIYHVSYPENLLYFMKYDFNTFMERCTDLCKLYMKTGEYRQEEAAEIRNSISGCHRYFEQNLRGVFEKIVIDCWVEYICRQSEIGVITLWNSYIPCRNDFERAVFMRLSEYRHGHAINQWVNILKVQEYATIKTDFIFGGKLKSSSEAAARANYFDLMFNVVANELGYDLNAVADNKVYTMGRTPNSPFIMSNVSREIVRNLLADLRYADDKIKIKKNEIVSDQTAMDAFSSMKSFLPQRGDNIAETMIKSLAEIPMKVYMPTSLKAAVDLEIDVMIENEAYLQKCSLCKDYYMRCEEFDYEYCDKVSKSGRSCLEIMSSRNAKEDKNAAKKPDIDAVLLNERCDRLYKEMSSRVNIEFTQRDFSDWCRYLTTIRENVLSGEATQKDFENFIEYSRSMAFPGGKPGRKRLPEAKPEKPEKDSRGRTVKPFVFERVERSDIVQPEVIDEPYEFVTVKEEPKPKASRVSSRIIRGVAPLNDEAPGTGVPIPYKKPKEEDVKIYNVKNKEPEKPEEFVRVFEPKKLEKAPRVTARRSTPKPRVEEPLREERPIIREESKPIPTPLRRERVPAFSEPPAISLSPPKPRPEKKEEEKIDYGAARIYASQKSEETMELGFHDILRGLERKDGFEENIPTDADGVPVSHKTKRVMDAIFKPSKPSLFINPKNDDS